MIRDTLTHLDLSVYPEIALVIFFGIFLAISVRVLRRGGATEAREASRMPLDEGTEIPVPVTNRAPRGRE